MAITTTFFDGEAKKTVYDYAGIPNRRTHEMWSFDQAQGIYTPNRLRVKVRQENAHLEVLLYGGYLRCCGMRECGEIDFNRASLTQQKALVAEFFNSPWFKNQNVGCLLYTKVMRFDGYRLYKDGWDFVANWPGTVSEGGWWYNPNSGHHCCNVTLSFDAKPKVYGGEEEEEDED